MEEKKVTLHVLKIDGQALKVLIEAGLTWLRTNQELVNSLNVFPVPDGDTGINMVLTMQSAFDEIKDSGENNLGRMMSLLANGALMGARGNSGVILSQLLRGMARGIEGSDLLTPEVMVKAFKIGCETAYRGVVRPVEGTILTVTKDIAEATSSFLSDDIDTYQMLKEVVNSADLSVERTPDLLPVLKEAGVVDAGGKGLYFILAGMLRYIEGEALDVTPISVKPLAELNLEFAMESIEPGQDYEIVVDFRPSNPLNLENFYSDLEEMGTSIQVGEGDGLYRMHIHVPTDNRYIPIDYTMSIGTVIKVAIENLLDQMESLDQAPASQKINLQVVEPGKIAVVAVSPGAGITRVFASLGCSAIVEGGQSMNPSTQEILNSFENLPTDKIIILPNNKNIIMAAKSTSKLSVKKVVVIPTKTIPQGLSAMLRLDADGEIDQVGQEMLEAMDEVQSGEITTATRTVEIDGINVEQGEIISLLNGKLIASSDSLEEACLLLLQKVKAEDYELITLFYGNTVSKPEVNLIADKLRETYPDQEIEIQEGSQPHYQFIISIE